MGFMRRFDPGYAAAKKQVDEGRIGRPVVFKSTSRDPFPPSVEYANPKSSGGMIIDMGIHDFDLARWFMGEVASVQAVGGDARLSGARDASATATTSSRRSPSPTAASGVVDLTRNGFYGYDITHRAAGHRRARCASATSARRRCW